MNEFTCKTCGVKFSSYQKKRVYCSRQCQRIGQQDKQKEIAQRYYAGLEHAKPVELECVSCGRKFLDKNPRVKYCSDDCRRSMDALRSHAKTIPTTSALDRELARLRKESTINKVLKEAKKQGLSYGQMMARKYERKMNDEQTTG